VYVLVIYVMIRFKGLLPKNSKSRSVAIFFGRIIIIFVAFYLPSTAIMIVLMDLDTSSILFFWLVQTNMFLGVLQTLVTMYMLSFKADIWNVVCYNFLVCTCRQPTNTTKDEEQDLAQHVKNGVFSNRTYATERMSQMRLTSQSSFKMAHLGITDKSINIDRDEEKDLAQQMNVPEGSCDDEVKGIISIDCIDPKPIDAIHLNINDDDGEESAIWVGSNL